MIWVLLLVIISFFVWGKWQSRVAASLFVCSLSVFLLAASGVLSAYLLKNLQSDFHYQPKLTWGKRNIIILLGSGNVRLPNGRISPGLMAWPRIHEAARLYHLCKLTTKTCNILISGGDPAHTGRTEALVYEKSLINIGVNQANIFQESRSKNTWQNATFTARFLRNKNYDTKVLVTSGFHMRRSLMYFAHAKLYPVPAVSDALSMHIPWVPQIFRLLEVDIALHEYLGMLQFYLYNYLGWNK